MKDFGQGKPVVMVCDPIQRVAPPRWAKGFALRPMTMEEIPLWTRIQRRAEPWCPIADDQFEKSFGCDAGKIGRRCFFIVDGSGNAVGTISAWDDDDFEGRSFGRLHWLAVVPAAQRKGLARAATAHVMQLLKAWHGRAYLHTQSNRIPAIKLYLEFGYRPWIRNDGDKDLWSAILGRI